MDWSIKKLIRALVLTRTFQLAHTPSAAALEADPLNRLLSHYPARRMEAEAIRDALLATSGRLDRTLYGPSIAAYRDKEYADRRLFRGPRDGNGRRSIYIKVTLMEPPKFLEVFNFPGGKVCQGRRDVTSTPAQALALLNDPFVLGQAAVWANKVIERKADTVATRISSMFGARPAGRRDPVEQERLERFVGQVATLHHVPESGVLTSLPVWRDVGHRGCLICRNSLRFPEPQTPYNERVAIPILSGGDVAMLRLLLILSSFTFVLGSAAAQDWQPVTEALILAEKPGYGKLCGIAVDHANGDVYINLSDKGLYRSIDAGQAWQRIGIPFKGRTETPGCLMLDPLGGKRLVVALVYGSPILVSADRGETFKTLDKKSGHVDWCAVDWSEADPAFILTLKHESSKKDSGDMLLVSRDGGKQFDEVGVGYGPAWIFDSKTAVVAQAKCKTFPKPVLVRTTDAGKTFAPCGDYHAKAAVPRWYKDTLYWLTEGSLISTKDQGKTWTKLSDLKNGRFGPIFGKTAQHLFVLTQAGIVESNDGGKSWSKTIATPKEMKGIGKLSWMEYDPTRDVVYVMSMNTELYRWQRGK